MDNESIQRLKEKISKLIYELEYDKSEMERLFSFMSQALSLEENNKASLIDKLLTLKLKKEEKKAIKYWAKRHEDIQNAIEQDSYKLLLIAIYEQGKPFFELRNKFADNRYDLKKIIEMPYSNFARQTMVVLYNELKLDITELLTLSYKVETYLNKKLSADKELNQ